MTAVTGGRWHRADLGLVGAVLILAALSALLLAGTDPSVAEVAWQSLVTPVAAIELLLDSDDAAAIGWWVIGGYSLMYAGTAALLAARGFLPQVKPLLPISPEHYYERQVLFTVPTGVGCTVLGFLVTMGLAGLFGADGDASVIWAGFSLAMVMPTLVTMWVPETFGSFLGGPGAETVPGPSWFHNGRIVLGSLWAVALAVVAVAVPTTLPWWQAVMAGGAGATVTGITMPLVLR